MINSTQSNSDVQGTEEIDKNLIREKLESQLDTINECGSTLKGLQLFLQKNLDDGEIPDKAILDHLESTLSGLAFLYRVLSQTHADLNKSDDGEK